MSRFVSIVKKEITELIPPTIFFFIALHIVVLMRYLMLKGTGIPIVSSFVVTVAALTLGKSVLIVDAFPFINRYPGRPLAYNIAWKTAIYSVVASFIHYLENLYDFWRQTGDLAAANQKLLAAVVWPHFVATEILLIGIVFIYCTIREIIRAIGPDKAREMFFGPPRRVRRQLEE